MLRIDIQAVHPKVTLRCSGKIVLGLEAETLRCMATSRQENCLTLDLAGVHTLDAAGLGLLVELHCWAIGAQKKLRIAEPSLCVRKLITLTNLQSIFAVAPCEQLNDVETQDDEFAEIGEERAMSA
jgi:anti-anti-sigma factor